MSSQQLSLVEYIKKQYPKVVFKPFKFAYKRALGFIVSENNLIVGFINKSGHLCKVSDPIDLRKLDSSKSINELLKNIPQVEGFSEKDKERLLRYLSNSKLTIPKSVHEQLVKELRDRIKKADEEKSQYKILLDSQTNEVLVIKKQYEEDITKLKEEFKNRLEHFSKCQQKLLSEKEIIKSEIQKFKESVKEYVRRKDVKTEQLERIHNQLLTEKEMLQKQLETFSLSNAAQLEKISKNQDLLSDYEVKMSDKEEQLQKLNDTVKELQGELTKIKDELSKAELKVAALEGYKSRCTAKLMNEKQVIINEINRYNMEWMKWLERAQGGLEEERKRLIQEAFIAQQRLREMGEQSVLDKEELSKLKQNIADVQASMQKVINDQLVQLSLKEEQIKALEKKAGSTELELLDQLKQKDTEIEKLRQQLVEVNKLLEQNRNTKVEPVINYDKCHMMVQQYIAMHNTFVRKQKILDIIGDIITKEYKTYSQLSPKTKENIKSNYERVKFAIEKHIELLDFQGFMKREDFKKVQDKKSRNNVSGEFCDSLANKLLQWEEAKLEYWEQDRQLTNLYEDLSGAVRVYIRLKPRSEKNEKGSATITSVEEKKIKSIDVDCNGKRHKYSDFYGVYDENYKNIDVYTGKENTPEENGLNVDIDNINEISDTISPGLYSVFKQVEDGYSIVLFGYGLSGSGKTYSLLGDDSRGVPGVLHYGLANMRGVKNIRLKYLFEQYYRTVNPSVLAIQGKICNLVGSVPGLGIYSFDETRVFNEYIEKSNVNVKNIKVEDLYPLTKSITEYRVKQGRIKRTPNNKESSRSHLYMVFEVEFEPDERLGQSKGKRGYVTIVDTAGRESPLDIMETFLDVADNEKSQQDKEKMLNNKLVSLLIPGTNIGMKLVQDHKRVFGKIEEGGKVIDLDEEYTPSKIIDIVKEGVYINESINHLIYYFKTKNHIVIRAKDLVLQTTNHYNKRHVFVKPYDEMSKGPRKEVNCLMIPILEFLDSLSKSPNNEFKPTKFVTLVAVRQEAKYCDQLLETLDFAQAIKSS